MQKNLQNLLSLKEFCIKKLVFYVLFTIVTGTLELNVNKREMEVKYCFFYCKRKYNSSNMFIGIFARRQSANNLQVT